MNQANFRLIPFSTKNAPEINITGTISRQANRLNLKYQLGGDLSTVIIPKLNSSPTRRYDLWDRTCFEFFLRLKDTSKYWEFNLAPTGDWNVFRFHGLRQNIAEEMTFKDLPFKVMQTDEYLRLDIYIDLDRIIDREQNLDVAITTVVENKDRQLSYWALTHLANEPDFHHQDSFLIRL